MSDKPSDSDVRQFNVGYDDEGIRLDRWFKRHLPDTSFTTVAKWARTGQLRVDGARATPGDRIAAGQIIRVPPAEPVRVDEVTGAPTGPKKRERDPLSAEQIEFIRDLVIHKDRQAIVINKPPGLATQGGTKTTEHVDGLLDGLTFDGESRPKLVHRLDKDTSGVLLVAGTLIGVPDWSLLCDATGHPEDERILRQCTVSAAEIAAGRVDPEQFAAALREWMERALPANGEAD